MTWDELKAKIEEEIELCGEDGSIEVNYIDVGMIYDGVEVTCDQDGLTVSS